MGEISALQKNLLRRATFGDGLRRNAMRNPKKPLVISYDQDHTRIIYTYEDINESANRFANAMLKLGIQKGDIVAVMSRNLPQYIIAWFGIAKIGAILTGVNYTFKENELVYQINHADAKVFIVEDNLVDLVDKAKPNILNVQHFVAFNLSSKPLASGWHDFAQLISGDYPSSEPEVEINDTDVALLIYTSGTESFPKGVMIQHRNYYSSTILSFVVDVGLNLNDVILYYMPFYTVTGLGTLTAIVVIGGTIVLPLTVDPGAALQVIQKEKVSFITQTPAFYQKLAQTPGFEQADFSTLQRCITYGGLMPRAMVKVWSDAAPQMKWGTYWGQSELSQLGTVGWFKTIEDIPGQDPAWIGRAVTTLETKVVDDDDNDVVVGFGELVCRGPSTMLGYYNDEERTQNNFRNGWVHTGDIVRVDKDGNLFFFDRKKDIIKTGGLNVSSFEVQDVIYKDPKVAEVAVIGLPDQYWSEIITAVIVLKKGEESTEEDILQLCKESLANFKVPKQIIFADELPKDTQGKILKRELRRLFSSQET